MISVIITTCKRETVIIERAIRSVLAQTYPHWELLVVDDNEAECAYHAANEKMVQKYAAAFPVYYVDLHGNYGACKARNAGIAKAKGEYIAFLDDDDEFLPEKLEKQVRFLQQHPQVAFVSCGAYMVDEKTGNKTPLYLPAIKHDAYEELLHAGSNFLGGCSFPLIRTSLLREIGGFDEELQSCQDYDVWLRIAQKYPLAVLPELLLNYYVCTVGQISRNYRKKIQGHWRLYQKNQAYLQQHPAACREHLYSLAYYQAWNGDWRDALQNWGKSVYLAPFAVCRNLRNLAALAKRYFLFRRESK